jgi:hypothetical protein
VIKEEEGCIIEKKKKEDNLRDFYTVGNGTG